MVTSCPRVPVIIRRGTTLCRPSSSSSSNYRRTQSRLEQVHIHHRRPRHICSSTLPTGSAIRVRVTRRHQLPCGHTLALPAIRLRTDPAAEAELEPEHHRTTMMGMPVHCDQHRQHFPHPHLAVSPTGAVQAIAVAWATMDISPFRQLPAHWDLPSYHRIWPRCVCSIHCTSNILHRMPVIVRMGRWADMQ